MKRMKKIIGCLVLCIAFVKNGMTNMSAEAVTSLIVSIGFGIFINLLWIVDSKTWITDYGKRKCIWSYWCGEIVLLLLVVALENMNQLVATSAILGMMAVYLIIGIWWGIRRVPFSGFRTQSMAGAPVPLRPSPPGWLFAGPVRRKRSTRAASASGRASLFSTPTGPPETGPPGRSQSGT